MWNEPNFLFQMLDEIFHSWAFCFMSIIRWSQIKRGWFVGLKHSFLLEETTQMAHFYLHTYKNSSWDWYKTAQSGNTELLSGHLVTIWSLSQCTSGSQNVFCYTRLREGKQIAHTGKNGGKMSQSEFHCNNIIVNVIDTKALLLYWQ